MQHPLFDEPIILHPQSQKFEPLPPANELTVFDEAGVDDNYAGKLALHQIQQMRKSVFNLVVVISGAFIVTLFLGLTAWSNERIISSILAIAILFFICGGFCFTLIWRVYKLRREINGQVVFHIDGRIRLLREIKKTRRGSIHNHAIFVNDIKFYVPEAALKVCRRDMNYRLYYTPITHEFVNIHSLWLPTPAEELSDSIRKNFDIN